MASNNPYAAPTTVEPAKPVKNDSGGRFPLATRWQRLAGSLVDAFTLVFMVVPMSYGASFLIESAYPEVYYASSQTIFIVEETLAMVLISIAFLALNGYLLANRGQTLGKYVVGTRIVADDNSAVSFLRLFFLRYFLVWSITIIPTLGNLFSLVNSLAIFRDNRKCLHDNFAGTKVVVTTHAAHRRELPEKLDFSKIE